jgi:formate/nitrite transporter FocA (FNT family)
MMIIAQIAGLAAVVTFLLSYQMKKRVNIILCNSVSRVLYVVQYLLLGAFEGAVLDVLGTFSSFMAGYKDKGIIKRYLKIIVVSINILIFVCGMFMYIAVNVYKFTPLATIMSVSAFILSGTNHCVADMFYTAVSLGITPLWGGVSALICTTLGNIIGANILGFLVRSHALTAKS